MQAHNKKKGPPQGGPFFVEWRFLKRRRLGADVEEFVAGSPYQFYLQDRRLNADRRTEYK